MFFFLLVFPSFLDCVFKVYILLKDGVVECDRDVVGVSTGGVKRDLTVDCNIGLDKPI